MFGLPDDAPELSLGEGGTELVWREVAGRQIGFKLEYQNPTRSFKDRGAAVLVSFLKSRGVSEAVEDSSGNAGAAFAAYAAKGGIRARVFTPDSAALSKRKRIEAYEAELVRILGPRSNAAQAALRAVDQGAVYASHAYHPHVLLGYATIAYELVAEMGGAPGTVIAPAGYGNLVLGLGLAFQSLDRAGLIEGMPRLAAVQAMACAPLWAVASYGPSGLGWVTEGETLAEGVRIKYPVRGDAVLNMVATSEGTFLSVEEEDILPGRDELAGIGFKVEPTSAIAWDGLMQVIDQAPEPIVVVLTGAGSESRKPNLIHKSLKFVSTEP
jgi:threonine synthase